MVFYGAPGTTCPRLSVRRRSPRAGHQLAIPSGNGISLRCSRRDAGKAVCLLRAHHKKIVEIIDDFFMVRPARLERTTLRSAI